MYTYDLFYPKQKFHWLTEVLLDLGSEKAEVILRCQYNTNRN